MSLIDADWNREWMAMQEQRRRPDDAGYWDGRAEDFRLKEEISSYARTFIEYSRLEPDDNILDMGCGAGALALPLARLGHEVVAVDFSPRMIGLLEEQAAERNLGSIRTMVASWEDDWDAAGIPVCDVALASRSIAVDDLQTAILKLEAHARRRVGFTIACGFTPRYDAVLEESLGRTRRNNADFVYALNILFSLGRFPELRYITSIKQMAYASPEAARAEIEGSLGVVEECEREALERYYAAHLVSFRDGDRTLWHKDYQQVVRWAHISWDR